MRVEKTVQTVERSYEEWREFLSALDGFCADSYVLENSRQEEFVASDYNGNKSHFIYDIEKKQVTMIFPSYK